MPSTDIQLLDGRCGPSRISVSTASSVSLGLDAERGGKLRRRLLDAAGVIDPCQQPLALADRLQQAFREAPIRRSRDDRR